MSEPTARDIAGAAKLAGLEFSPRKVRQALKGIDRFLGGYDQRRGLALANGDAPAETFDPRLPGMTFAEKQRPFVRSREEAPPLPGDDASIAFAPLKWLSQWVERGELSSKRLTGIYLERLSRHGPRLECVATLMEDDALAAAARADREIARGRYRGPLHGIPWGAKDLLDTAGVPTEWGAAPFRGRVPTRDATVVHRLQDAGAVLVAKLTLGALAMGDRWDGGFTRNPFDVEQGSSGSSAGSASAVAAGLVGFAIGSETLGSIVSPSIRCGVAGLRPTFGRVPRTGAMALSWSMDKLGPLCRTSEDTALVLAAIAGTEPATQCPRDDAAIKLPFNYDGRKGAAGMRVGYFAGQFRGKGSTASDRATRDLLGATGVEVLAVRPPRIPSDPFYALLLVEAATAFDEMTRSGQDDLLSMQTDDAWPNVLRQARLIPAVEYVQARRLRRKAMEEMRVLFERNRLDAILSPSRPGPLLTIANVTGHPSLTLRTSFDRSGHPRGITLTGRLFDEGSLVRLGTALEKAAGVWARRPVSFDP